jgi:DNA-binding transcriptional LysR family regulator
MAEAAVDIMDLWLLRYFVCAAETLNFTKAAKRLYITQPALSRKIADLEEHFGAQLFIRGKRSLQLTAAGQILLNECRIILARWDGAAHKIQMAVAGSVGRLRVAYAGGFVKTLMPDLARRFRKSHPDIDLHIERFGVPALKDALWDGDVDIAFVLSSESEPPAGLVWKQIKQEVLTAVFPFDHPFADRGSISLPELAGEPFVFIARSVNQEFFDYFMRMCAAFDFSPNIVEQPLLLETTLVLVEAGFGVTVLSRLADMGTSPNLQFVPLEGDYPITLAAAWKKENGNPAIPLFVELLKGINSEA